MKTEVVAAFIKKDNKFLIAKKEDKWEFPGGKVKEGEKREDALVRELKEELNLKIKVNSFLFKYEKDNFIFYFYSVEIEEGDLILKEHKMVKWISFKDLKKFKFYEPDEKFLYSMASFK